MLYQPMNEIDLVAAYPTFDVIVGYEQHLYTLTADQTERDTIKAYTDEAARHIFSRRD